jgi:O-antigen/teichoic acid export membrane protein
MTEAAGRRKLGGGAAIAAAFVVTNLANYAYTVAAARLLGPRSFGAFAALMGLLLIVGVLALGLQATGARRISSEPDHVEQIERSILRVGHRAAVVAGLLCLALAPVVNQVLRLDSLASAALVAVAALPLTVMGAQAGVLQGERRWVPLAVLYLANGLPRLAIGALLLIGGNPTELEAMLGVALGQWAPVVVGWWALRRPRTADAPAVPGSHEVRDVLGETFHSSHALLAFFALSNVDVLVARSVLTGHQAGLYAGGLVLVKAVLFLPQFIVVLAFPAMAAGSARRATLLGSLALVAVLGLLASAGTAVLSGLAVAFIGGPQYAQVEDRLWVFALLGTLLSMLQLLVYSVLARQSRRAVLFIWAALLVVAAGGQLAASYVGLLALVVTTDLALLVVLLGISLWRLRQQPVTG